MITTDPIADLLTRIKNAARARKEDLTLPHSKIKADILTVLKKRRFVQDFSVEVTKSKHKNLHVVLNPEKADIEAHRVSKPGRRMYLKSAEIKKVNGGLGVAILSTPKGVITGEEAKQMNLGGEIICEVY